VEVAGVWRELWSSEGKPLRLRRRKARGAGWVLAIRLWYNASGLVALAKVNTPDAPPPKAIVVRIDQIHREIATEHWEKPTRTRPIKPPYGDD